MHPSRYTFLLAAFLFFLSLGPRALVKGTFVTVDEADHWFPRADQFLQALHHGNYAGTNLVGHPGVTTMWLGVVGIYLRKALVTLHFISPTDAGVHQLLLRAPVGVVTAVAIALAYIMLRRLLGPRVAFFAGLLMATEPFLIAHAQLLHTDALLASFMLLALLAAALAFRLDVHDGRRDLPIDHGMLLGSAIAGGLAFLTKSPSILVIPTVGLIAIVGSWRGRHMRWPAFVLALLAWGAVAGLTWGVLWPATWVDLPGAVTAMYRQATADGGQPHAWGNFFWGHAVADPGPWFYPVTILLRLTPWTCVGVVFLVGAALVRRTRLRGAMLLVLLTFFALSFVVAMTVGAKKFDRYVLPVYPILDILAAAGWIALAEALRRVIQNHLGARITRMLGYSTATLAILIFMTNVKDSQPYTLAYFNPLFGGGPVAAKTIPVGWGEGLEQAAAWLKTQYDGCDRPIAAWFGEAIQPFTCAKVVPLDWALQPGKAHYAVLYIDQIQRNDVPQVTAMLLGKAKPIHVVRIHGIDYAYIYELPQAVAHATDASFGDALLFHGYTIDASALRTTATITATLQWTASHAPAANLNMFAHVLDANGNKVAGVDIPMVGPQARASSWTPDRPTTWEQPIPVGKPLATGTYWIAIGLYDTGDFKRLSLKATSQPSGPNDGGNALLLGPIQLH